MDFDDTSNLGAFKSSQSAPGCINILPVDFHCCKHHHVVGLSLRRCPIRHCCGCKCCRENFRHGVGRHSKRRGLLPIAVISIRHRKRWLFEAESLPLLHTEHVTPARKKLRVPRNPSSIVEGHRSKCLAFDQVAVHCLQGRQGFSDRLRLARSVAQPVPALDQGNPTRDSLFSANYSHDSGTFRLPPYGIHPPGLQSEILRIPFALEEGCEAVRSFDQIIICEGIIPKHPFDTRSGRENPERNPVPPLRDIDSQLHFFIQRNQLNRVLNRSCLGILRKLEFLRNKIKGSISSFWCKAAHSTTSPC